MELHWVSGVQFPEDLTKVPESDGGFEAEIYTLDNAIMTFDHHFTGQGQLERETRKQSRRANCSRFYNPGRNVLIGPLANGGATRHQRPQPQLGHSIGSSFPVSFLSAFSHFF